MSTVLPLITYGGDTLVLERFIRKERTVEILTKSGVILEVSNENLGNEELQEMLNVLQSELKNAMKYIQQYGTAKPFDLDSFQAQYNTFGALAYKELNQNVLLVCDNAIVYVSEFDFSSYNGIGVCTVNGVEGELEFTEEEKVQRELAREQIEEAIGYDEEDGMVVVTLKGVKYVEHKKPYEGYGNEK